jgi:hypothetical protein
MCSYTVVLSLRFFVTLVCNLVLRHYYVRLHKSNLGSISTSVFLHLKEIFLYLCFVCLFVVVVFFNNIIIFLFNYFTSRLVCGGFFSVLCGPFWLVAIFGPIPSVGWNHWSVLDLYVLGCFLRFCITVKVVVIFCLFVRVYFLCLLFEFVGVFFVQVLSSAAQIHGEILCT